MVIDYKLSLMVLGVITCLDALRRLCFWEGAGLPVYRRSREEEVNAFP